MMTVAHGEHFAKLLPNGKVLTAGTVSNSSSADLYDPASGTWTSTGSLAGGRSETTAVLLNNGKLLVAGVASITTNAPDMALEIRNGTEVHETGLAYPRS